MTWMKCFSGTAVLLIFSVLQGIGAETVDYTYDSAGRLKSVASNRGRNLSYTYDSAGNLLRRVVTAETDLDADGLPDDWEVQYFGNLTQNGNGDVDNDGMSNRSEYFAGTNPVEASSLFKVASLLPGSQGAFIQWHAVAGKTYRLQYKNSLTDASWNDVPGDITATGATAEKTDSTSPQGIQRYYRVMLVQ